MKCKHDNGELIEVMTATHSRIVLNGVCETIGYNEIGNITGYQFHCIDCKKWFKWSCGPKAPKWAQRYFDSYMPQPF